MTTTPDIVAPPTGRDLPDDAIVTFDGSYGYVNAEGPCQIVARDGGLVPMTIAEQEIIRAGEGKNE